MSERAADNENRFWHVEIPMRREKAAGVSFPEENMEVASEL